MYILCIYMYIHLQKLCWCPEQECFLHAQRSIATSPLSPCQNSEMNEPVWACSLEKKSNQYYAKHSFKTEITCSTAELEDLTVFFKGRNKSGSDLLLQCSQISSCSYANTAPSSPSSVPTQLNTTYSQIQFWHVHSCFSQLRTILNAHCWTLGPFTWKLLQSTY